MWLGSKAFTQVKRKLGYSQFWSGLMNVMDGFFSVGNFILQDDKQVKFWEDRWLGEITLKDQYPTLYNIVRRKVYNHWMFLLEEAWLLKTYNHGTI
jgi:hypothetical protein